MRETSDWLVGLVIVLRKKVRGNRAGHARRLTYHSSDPEN